MRQSSYRMFNLKKAYMSDLCTASYVLTIAQNAIIMSNFQLKHSAPLPFITKVPMIKGI